MMKKKKVKISDLRSKKIIVDILNQKKRQQIKGGIIITDVDGV